MKTAVYALSGQETASSKRLCRKQELPGEEPLAEVDGFFHLKGSDSQAIFSG